MYILVYILTVSNNIGSLQQSPILNIVTYRLVGLLWDNLKIVSSI